MDRVQQVLSLAGPGPALQNGRALCSSLQALLPTVLSAQSVPHAPQKAGTEGMREGKKGVFSRDAAKHQLNPKQRKLWPQELTYIVLHVLFRGSELLVIRAATRWVNQPKTESKCQQSSPVSGQGLLNLPPISTETSAIATPLAFPY